MKHDTESYSPKSDVNDIQDDMKNACSVRDVLTILLATTRKAQNMHISLPVTSVISEPAEAEFSFETHGDPSSPLTIVLIHGGYQSRHSFKERVWWKFLTMGNAFLHEIPPDDAPQRLKKLTIPTLLLHGKNDAHVPLLYSREVANLIPNTQLIEIDQCEHAAMLEQPTIVNRKMVNFLADLAVV